MGMKPTLMVADMRMFVWQLDETHKELFVTWIGVHLSALVHKPYKTMELMLLAVQLHQLVYKKIRRHILQHTLSMKQILLIIKKDFSIFLILIRLAEMVFQ